MSLLRKRRLPPIHAQALNILKAYGANANLYLPGVGAINGITAGNYLDSAGTTAASTDQPIGLMLDAMGVLGAELATQSSWAAPGIGGPAFTVQDVTPTKTIGKTYVLSATVSGYSGSGTVGFSGVEFGGSAASSISGNGSIYAILQVTATAPTALYTRSTNTATFGNISVREIPGIHASQATTAAKPILRLTGGLYSAQFDGVDDFLQTTATTGNEGWVCAGANFADANVTFFSSGTNAANAGIWLYRNVGGAKSMNLAVANGSTIAYSPNLTPPSGTPVIVSGGWTPTAVFAGVNNTESIDSARTGISSSVLPLRIGGTADGSYALSGNLYPSIYIAALPSPADRTTLRKFVASLSGVTL